MFEGNYNVFLSCSVDEADKDVVDFFKKMVNSFEMVPLVNDYTEIGGLTDKVKEKIEKSDCLIAVITRKDKIEGSNKWSGPAWVQHEITLAHAFNKTVAVFLENGVVVEGLIEREERRVTFSRNDLIGEADKISSFLFSLRKYLEKMDDKEIALTPYLFRHYMRSRQEICSKDTVIERTEICIESLIDNLNTAYHKRQLDEMTEGISVKPSEFDFKCLEHPSRTKVEHKLLVNTSNIFSWQISFDPPLKKGDRVTYAYKKVVPLNNPYNYEELMQRIKAGTYKYQEPKCEACEWFVAYPTYELRHEFEFPENYEISGCNTDVLVGRERLKAVEEQNRIREEGMFSAEKIFDKWVLKLNVSKPLTNHVYYTYYVPPSEKD